MNFASHAKAGFWISMIAGGSHYFIKDDLKFSAIAGALTFIGSVLPDLDTDSIPSRWAARFGLAFTCVCIYTANYFPAVVAGGLFFAIKSGQHRGFTHRYSLCVLCFGLGAYHGNFLYMAFGVGLLCHYIVDQLSPLNPKSWL